MGDNRTLTTGQVSGLLGIPQTTLRRYIREFGKHFSESARIRTRGRRWTQADIELLLSIRRMHQAQQGISAIDQALTNHVKSPSDQPSMLDAYSVLAIAQETLDQVHQERLEIEKIIRQAKFTEYHDSHLDSWLEKKFDWINHELQDLRYQTNKTRLYLNPPRRYPINKRYREVWTRFMEWFHQTERDELNKMT